MLAEVVRSGLVEADHDGAVAVVDADGRVVAHHGDIDRAFYGRSSLKPFQALVSQRHGADLVDEALALACASHAGLPEHLAVVRAMLAEAGLTVEHLGTPSDRPGSPDGIAALAAEGMTAPSPLFHNCSGKHAAMLIACQASGFELTSYRSPNHPLQLAVGELLEEVLDASLPPPGVDGCGLPTHVVTARSMARAFAVLATDDDYGSIRAAMAEHPVLIGDVGRVDGVLSAAGMPSKIGAEGCIGVAVPDRGLGIVVKAWDGSGRAHGPVVAAVAEHLGIDLGDTASELAVPVLGSGEPVGTVRAAVDLR